MDFEVHFFFRMLPQEIENRIGEIRSQIESAGAELVDIQFHRGRGRSVLSILADKEGGISLDECAEINRRLSEYFEFLEGSFLLEVSSPGLDRPLTSEKDFSRRMGEKVKVTFRDTTGKTATWTGKLVGVQNQVIEMELKDGARKAIGLNQILKAIREITF